MRTDADDLARVRDPAIELLLSHTGQRDTRVTPVRLGCGGRSQALIGTDRDADRFFDDATGRGQPFVPRATLVKMRRLMVDYVVGADRLARYSCGLLPVADGSRPVGSPSRVTPRTRDRRATVAL